MIIEAVLLLAVWAAAFVLLWRPRRKRRPGFVVVLEDAGARIFESPYVEPGQAYIFDLPTLESALTVSPIRLFDWEAENRRARAMAEVRIGMEINQPSAIVAITGAMP